MSSKNFFPFLVIFGITWILAGCHTQFTIRTDDVRKAIIGGNDAGLTVRNNTAVTTDIQAGPFQFIVKPGASAHISYRANFYASRSLHMEVTAMPYGGAGSIRAAKLSWDYSQWYNEGSWSMVDERVIVLELSGDGKEFYFK